MGKSITQTLTSFDGIGGEICNPISSWRRQTGPKEHAKRERLSINLEHTQNLITMGNLGRPDEKSAWRRIYIFKRAAQRVQKLITPLESVQEGVKIYCWNLLCLDLPQMLCKKGEC
jgi:hypothetical protein